MFSRFKNIHGTLYFTNPTFFKVDEMAVFIGFMRGERRQSIWF